MKRYTIEGEIDLVKVAIERLKAFEDFALQMNPGGYYVAYSGGKDSDTIRILCELAGVKHELWHNLTTVDAPETVRYVYSVVPKENINKPELSMWKLIVKKRTPPTRLRRYCCKELKENSGRNRFVVTGVRRAESYQRSDRESLEIVTNSKKNRVIFTGDNDENRRMIENCRTKGTRTLNLIIEWDDNDVWEFLNYYGCKSNPLYQCGYKRIGCIGCPMANRAMEKEFADYPAYKASYIRSFDRMLKKRVEDGLPTTWNSGEEVFDWWISDKAAEIDLDGQLDFWDFEDYDPKLG